MPALQSIKPFFPFKKRCRVLVIEDLILEPTKTNLNKLFDLWIREGAEKIFVYQHKKGAGNSPLPIRKFLKGVNSKYWLQGVFFLGDLPVAFFDGDPTGELYTSDYFFMELQGDWTFSDRNRVSTTAKLPPTIAAGRVVIGSQTGRSAGWQSAAECYNNYLKKAIDFRMKGEGYRENRKAVLISNLGGVVQYRDLLSTLYPPPLELETMENVADVQYRNIIQSGRDWVFFYGHGDSGEHHMANNTYWRQSDYSAVNLDVNIFQFVSCGAGQIAWHGNDNLTAQALPDPLVSNILGNPNGGAIAFAPSIAGYFSYIRDFYGFLRGGDSFGEAFRKIIKKLIVENHSHYISLYGDPFLSFNPVDTRIYIRKKTIIEQVWDKKKIEYV